MFPMNNCKKGCLTHVFMYKTSYKQSLFHSHNIRESVDSVCRDGAGPPIVCVHWKAVLTCEHSCSKPFWTPSYPIRTFLHSIIAPK